MLLRRTLPILKNVQECRQKGTNAATAWTMVREHKVDVLQDFGEVLIVSWRGHELIAKRLEMRNERPNFEKTQ